MPRQPISCRYIIRRKYSVNKEVTVSSDEQTIHMYKFNTNIWNQNKKKQDLFLQVFSSYVWNHIKMYTFKKAMFKGGRKFSLFFLKIRKNLPFYHSNRQDGRWYIYVAFVFPANNNESFRPHCILLHLFLWLNVWGHVFSGLLDSTAIWSNLIFQSFKLLFHQLKYRTNLMFIFVMNDFLLSLI